MTVYLPDYRYRPLAMLSVCGHVPDARADDEATVLFASSSFDDLDEPVWTRLAINKDALTGVHVHVDTARESVGRPSATDKIVLFDELASRLMAYSTQKMEFMARARFCIYPDELPQHNLIRILLRVSREEERRKVWLSGATFHIQTDRDFEIQWNLIEQGDRSLLVADIEWEEESPLDEVCLFNAFVRAKWAFSSLILEDMDARTPEEEAVK